MSCYTRHLVDLLDDLGYEDTKENRKRLDIAIRKAMAAEDLDCPEVWKAVKTKRNDEDFKSAVAEAFQP